MSRQTWKKRSNRTCFLLLGAALALIGGCGAKKDPNAPLRPQGSALLEPKAQTRDEYLDWAKAEVGAAEEDKKAVIAYRVATWLRNACSEGKEEACIGFSRWLETAPPGFASIGTEVRWPLERACDVKTETCVLLAAHDCSENGGKLTPAITDLYEESCKRRERDPACDDFFDECTLPAPSSGELSKGDREQLTCLGGGDCIPYAESFIRGNAPPPPAGFDLKRDMVDRCDVGNPRACLVLARFYHRESKGDEAEKALITACHNSRDYCESAAGLLKEAKPESKDSYLHLVMLSCPYASAAGCDEVARLCHSGNEEACDMWFLRRVDFSHPDVALKACAYGNARVCGLIVELAPFIAFERRAMKRAFERACSEENIYAACEASKNLQAFPQLPKGWRTASRETKITPTISRLLKSCQEPNCGACDKLMARKDVKRLRGAGHALDCSCDDLSTKKKQAKCRRALELAPGNTRAKKLCEANPAHCDTVTWTINHPQRIVRHLDEACRANNRDACRRLAFNSMLERKSKLPLKREEELCQIAPDLCGPLALRELETSHHDHRPPYYRLLQTSRKIRKLCSDKTTHCGLVSDVMSSDVYQNSFKRSPHASDRALASACAYDGVDSGACRVLAKAAKRYERPDSLTTTLCEFGEAEECPHAR